MARPTMEHHERQGLAYMAVEGTYCREGLDTYRHEDSGSILIIASGGTNLAKAKGNYPSWVAEGSPSWELDSG